jgi:hypothetical protein
MKLRILITAFGMVCAGNFAFAQSLPCLTRGAEIAVDNQQVLNWKNTTRNQFHARGHIEGTIRQIFSDHSGHHHYEVGIGPGADDTVEVIYNEDFGGVPQVRAGSTIEACGDYITSNAPSGHFPASPDGAILHWVHMSPSLQRHDSGFIILDGVVCGQDAGAAGPKH